LACVCIAATVKHELIAKQTPPAENYFVWDMAWRQWVTIPGVVKERNAEHL
jgi:hypothetical protein